MPTKFSGVFIKTLLDNMTATTEVCGMNFLHVRAFGLAIILSSFIHQGLGLIQSIDSRPIAERRLVQPLSGML